MTYLTKDDIIEFLRKNAYDYYRDDRASRRGEPEDRIYSALFHSLEPPLLAEVTNYLLIDHTTVYHCPRRLFYKANKILSDKVFRPGEDITSEYLLGLYYDKTSKKVVYASKELKLRYPTETHEMQCRILRAFLVGKGHLEWAARRIRDHWVEALASLVCERWEATHNKILAYAVLRHMPASYLLKEQDVLASVVDYAYVCARLGNEPEFEIDESRLSTLQYFYVIAKSGKYVNQGILMTKLRKWDGLKDISRDEFGLLLWSMGKLGLTDDIMALRANVKNYKNKYDI